MRKLFLPILTTLVVVSCFASVIHAQSASCSPTNITDDQCYEQNCTGQASEDSASCNSYALTAAGGDAACSNITSDTVYNNCCSGNEADDSAVCNAYANYTDADAAKEAVGTAATNALSSGTPASGTGSSSSSTNAPLNISLQNPLASTGVTDIPSAVNLILSVVIRIALPLIIIMFIWSGIMFIFARGNPTKIQTAKNMFLYTIIGTLLILGAWTITNALVGTVNTIMS